MKQLINHLQDILKIGRVHKNRTGVNAITKPWAMMVHDGRNTYPATTSAMAV